MDQFLTMAFAQLTYRESLRDIEVNLRAQVKRLYHMGLRCKTVFRNTLSNANATRPWQIYADFAQHLIAMARPLYAKDPMAIDLDATVYAFDATTIDLCLSVYPWAPFRAHKAAIKLHTLLDLRGSIPAFIYISDGKLHDVNVLDILPVEAGAFYVMDRGYVDFARLYAMHQAGAFFVTRAKSNMDARRVYSAPADRASGADLRSAGHVQCLLLGQELPGASAAHPLQGPRVGQDAGVHDQQHDVAGVDDCRPVQKPLAGGAVLQVDQAAPAYQAIPGHQRERGEDAGLVRHRHIRTDRHRQEGASSQCFALHLSTDPVGLGLREN